MTQTLHGSLWGGRRWRKVDKESAGTLEAHKQNAEICVSILDQTPNQHTGLKWRIINRKWQFVHQSNVFLLKKNNSTLCFIKWNKYSLVFTKNITNSISKSIANFYTYFSLPIIQKTGCSQFLNIFLKLNRKLMMKVICLCANAG